MSRISDAEFQRTSMHILDLSLKDNTNKFVHL